MKDIDKVKVLKTEEIDDKMLSKLEKSKVIIKGLFNAWYDGKVTNILLSSGFLYMVYAGIVEEYYLISVIYGFAFLRFTDFRSAYNYAKELINEYKNKKDSLNEKDLIEGETIYNELTSNEEIIHKK